MTLPVVLLGGAAWWFNQQAQLRVGPPRLLPLQWERVPVSANDVANGYDFAAKTKVRLVGDTKMPTTFGRFSPDYFIEHDGFHLRYRLSQGWKEVVFAKKELPCAFTIGDSDNLTVRFRLAGVPHNAQEVRVQGIFTVKQTFQAPSTWAPTAGYFKPDSYGQGRFRLWSVSAQQPLDIPIKRADEAFPAPQVSRENGFRFIEAKWFSRSSTEDQIVVRVRKLPSNNASQELKLSLLDFQLLDGKGRKIRLFSNNGTGYEMTPAGFGMRYHSSLGKQLPLDEDVFNVVWGDAPRGGWKTVKTPISLHLRLSREGAWPLDINTRLQPEPRDASIYGEF